MGLMAVLTTVKRIAQNRASLWPSSVSMPTARAYTTKLCNSEGQWDVRIIYVCYQLQHLSPPEPYICIQVQL